MDLQHRKGSVSLTLEDIAGDLGQEASTMPGDDGKRRVATTSHVTITLLVLIPSLAIAPAPAALRPHVADDWPVSSHCLLPLQSACA